MIPQSNIVLIIKTGFNEFSKGVAAEESCSDCTVDQVPQYSHIDIVDKTVCATFGEWQPALFCCF